MGVCGDKNKSSCIKSLTIYKQICQPWCFPQSTGYLAPAHSCMCVCLKESASGLAAQGACLYRPCLTHIVMMWPKGPCLPRTHMYTHTHVNTKCSGPPTPGVLPTVTPGFNIIISPPGWFGGIRGLQRERGREKA